VGEVDRDESETDRGEGNDGVAEVDNGKDPGCACARGAETAISTIATISVSAPVAATAQVFRSFVRIAIMMTSPAPGVPRAHRHRLQCMPR
jgi:hypothetical protein